MAQCNLSTAGGHSALHITHPNAAGIDIGSGSHFVGVPPDRDEQSVREFKSFTGELHRLADWLESSGVDTVSMESTRVYWIPLYEFLEQRGFTVLLVNARHVKNVCGRKSDVLDCQWLQQLHSFGLLRGDFRSGDAVCVLRVLTRQRAATLRTQARCVQHMQKALAQMIVQLTNVIADVVGETGQRILRAIVASERDPLKLAALKNAMIRASNDEIAASLQGNWRSEHLFALKQALASWRLLRHATGRVRHQDPSATASAVNLRRRTSEGAGGQKAQLRAQRSQVRSAYPSVSDVRGGSDPNRRYRGEHSAGGAQRGRHGHEPEGQASVCHAARSKKGVRQDVRNFDEDVSQRVSQIPFHKALQLPGKACAEQLEAGTMAAAVRLPTRAECSI